MRTMNKYGAVKVELDGHKFDSKFEADVYRLLKCYFAPCELRIHHPIEFAPKTERFPAWSWKVDFYIPSKGLYIEAKGVRTDEWISKLRAIDQLKPKVLDRLMVVSNKEGERICNKLYTINLAQLAAYLERFRR